MVTDIETLPGHERAVVALQRLGLDVHMLTGVLIVFAGSLFHPRVPPRQLRRALRWVFGDLVGREAAARGLPR